MKPKIVHQEAMNYSFQAKIASEEGNTTLAFDLYNKAASLESKLAEFYFDKPELEPTRSIMIRSAAFLNLKAGRLEEAKNFIFFGLLNSKDESIKQQLNNALEIALSLKNGTQENISREYSYLSVLRQKSVHYVLEPSNLLFGHSISLKMVKDFTDKYLKSLKAFALSQAQKIDKFKENSIEAIEKELDELINPLITNSSYGSFKFSIANDFLERSNEPKELVSLKSNIINKYHNEIFINPLTDTDIELIKNQYSEEEVNDIFKPLAKIKSNNTPYKIGYYDFENFNKSYVNKIVNKQRRQLLVVNKIDEDDIGELESYIVHKRSSSKGKITKQTIFKEHFKSYEVDFKTNEIIPSNNSSIILTEEIFINMSFDSKKGFTLTFDDFRISYTDTEYNKALAGFNETFYSKIIKLVNTAELDMQEQKDFACIKQLIGDLSPFKN